MSVSMMQIARGQNADVYAQPCHGKPDNNASMAVKLAKWLEVVQHRVTSASFLAELSVISPRKLLIIII